MLFYADNSLNLQYRFAPKAIKRLVSNSVSKKY